MNVGKRTQSRATRATLGAGLAPPLEWMDGRSWRLPSGQKLAEFALQAGFLAPLLFSPNVPARKRETALPAAAPVNAPAGAPVNGAKGRG